MNKKVTYLEVNMEPKLEAIMTDEYLDYLADNFVKSDYQLRYGVTFNKYLEMKKAGTWETLKEFYGKN